jgi:hypothetical protein
MQQYLAQKTRIMTAARGLWLPCAATTQLFAKGRNGGRQGAWLYGLHVERSDSSCPLMKDASVVKIHSFFLPGELMYFWHGAKMAKFHWQTVTWEWLWVPVCTGSVFRRDSLRHRPILRGFRWFCARVQVSGVMRRSQYVKKCCEKIPSE